MMGLLQLAPLAFIISCLTSAGRITKTKVVATRKHVANGTGSATTWKADFNSFMADLKVTKNVEGINKACEPYISEPSTGTKSLGLVYLQHGYTACAGFWSLLAPRLVEEGWTVMVPTAVGHGRKPTVVKEGATYTVTDYTDDLPEDGSKYAEYSDKMIEIVKKYKAANPGKEVVLAGVSLGGSIAAYAAMQAPDLWDRVLLMNPFLGAPTDLGADYGLSFVKDLIPKMLPAASIVMGDEIAWGPDCDKTHWPGQSENGHSGGMCHFKLTNFKAVLDFTNELQGESKKRASKLGVFTGGVFDRIFGVAVALNQRAGEREGAVKKHTRRTNMKVQLLTTSKDPTISNGRVHFAAGALTKELVEGNLGYCVMREEFEHTYISPPDSPASRDFWWLDPKRVVGGKTALDLLEDFITKGKLVPERKIMNKNGKWVPEVVEDDTMVKGDPRCDIEQA